MEEQSEQRQVEQETPLELAPTESMEQAPIESAEPAPYGGIMVQSLTETNERKELLQSQAVEVSVNNSQQTIRPEAIFIKGVDSLSTKEIESFINYYLNFQVSTETTETGDLKRVFEQLPLEEQLHFRVQWINDSSVNVSFKSHDEAKKALDAISITSLNPAIPEELGVSDYFSETYLSLIVQERETKPYNPTLEFQKQSDLASRLGIAPASNTLESSNMDEDESAVVLYTRISFQSDRKVKNASVYSRYYLLHGEPERKPYKKRPQHRQRRNRDYDDDLFRGKRGRDNNNEEEDLFAHKMRERERSPLRMEQD